MLKYIFLKTRRKDPIELYLASNLAGAASVSTFSFKNFLKKILKKR